MPVFHTKTIESILEPVAQQVERLVFMHEEAEDGNAMPDLERPVMAVSRAVTNLVKVGKETIQSSDDAILKQDMPPALHRVDGSARLLEEASAMLKADPYSEPARKKLIEGARGILQGTSALLLCFDESEVRKIIRECKKVLDYLAVAEVIENMEDLVQFVRDLSPCLTRVSREVDNRQKELTHQVHREILVRCLDQVKTLTPILICSMKIFIQIILQGGKGVDEAAENRNYLTSRMTDEINEIIRVLQLTTYDEDEWEADQLTSMKRAQNALHGKLQAAHDWLEDPTALRGGVGEKSLRQIMELAEKVADRSLPEDQQALHKLCSELNTLTNGLCELRQAGQGTSPQAESLARSIRQKLGELDRRVQTAVQNAEKYGAQQPAHTVAGRLEQARRWLANPCADDRGLGQQAISLIVEEGKKVAQGLQGEQRAEILGLCNQVDSLSRQLGDLCRSGQGNSPQAQAVARLLSQRLDELKVKIQNALVDRVVEDFMDVNTPLKQFTDAVLAPEGTPNRDQLFADRAKGLQTFSSRAAQTARMVAAGGSNGNKKLAEALLNSAAEMESLTPQLINAGRIRMAYPGNKAADEHFENLKCQFAETCLKARQLCDEATDSAAFIQQSEDLMQRYTGHCEDAIARQEALRMVEGSSQIARLANRVLMVAKQEADNSEDPMFIGRVTAAAEILQAGVAPMVQTAKGVAMNIRDPGAAHKWREANRGLLGAVGQVRKAVGGSDPQRSGLEQGLAGLGISENTPPRPPPPGGEHPPPRPPPPETDDEDEMFLQAPQANQPIMMAAHGLHQEVRQWSSKDNDIVAAAKRMALLMGKLSQLVRGEGGGKRELIACAKAIAEASEEVTKLAKGLAAQCTDKRMRTNLLQVCERIPTISTQLKILSTVKATMLGAQGSEEDQEATDMLVGNAQNLMQSVKETVRAAEAASIKIRTDAGIRLRWVRRQPWYQH